LGSLGPVTESILFVRIVEVGLILRVTPQELEREVGCAQVGKIVVGG
jgi:hypothetical protein